MNKTWYYLTSEDMKLFYKVLPKELYWKLSAQARARIPMLTESYNQLKKKYINIYNK